MSKGGGGGGGTTTVRQEPADFIRKYYEEAAKASQGLYGEGAPEFFPGSTFVPFSPESELAMQAQTNRAITGSPLTQAAQDQTLSNIRGDYLSGSEFLRPALDAEYARIGGNVNSQFATQGAYGSSANQQVLAREQAKAANQALLENYGRERGIQQAAIAQAPAMAQQDYYDIGALREVGQSREDLFGRQLQDQLERYQYESARDATSLDDYIRRITGLGGNFQTQTTTVPTVKTSPLNSILGLGQLALGAYGAFSNPAQAGQTVLRGLFG